MRGFEQQTYNDLDMSLNEGVVTLCKTTEDGVRELFRLEFGDLDDQSHTDVAVCLALIMKADLTDSQKSFACFWIGGWWMEAVAEKARREL